MINRPGLRIVLIAVLAAAFAFTGYPFQPHAAQAAPANIVISQVYGGGGNSGGIYTNDFVELYNRGSSSVSLAGWSIQYTSATGTGNFGANTGLLTPLSGTLDPGHYFLIQEAAGSNIQLPLPTPNITDSTPINMSGTGGKVALVNTTTPLGCNGSTTPCSAAALATLVDLVGWDGANFYEGSGPAPATTNSTAVLRKLDGAQDTDNNSADFISGAPNPRNTLPPDAAPQVVSTVPADGAAFVPYDSNVTINFSEAVNVSGAWFNLTCTLSGSHTASVSGGPVTFTLDPGADFVAGEACTLTVNKDLVSDQDSNDPPDTMTVSFSIGFSTGSTCLLGYTPIYTIQGSGLTTPIPGTVTTQGVVVGDFEGPSPALRGFYLQDAAGDGNLLTSDGIFVFNGNNDSVSLGDVVRVTGTAEEYQDQTEIGSVTSIVNCGVGSVAPLDVTLPFASATAAESAEGMLVRLQQTLFVTEHYQLGRFGEVLLSSGARLQQPTNVVSPGAPALALQTANNLNQILIDDSTQNQNPDPILFGRGGMPLSASNTLRGGDTATGIVGVMTYTWGGNSASPNAYRVRPLNALDGYIDFQPANERPAGAPALTGRLRVVGMNLLNYFNTFGVGACTLGVGGGPTDCRGADDLVEFDRQWPKTVAAILGTQADVIGVIEMENDGYGSDSAIQDLVNKLNTVAGPDVYAFIDVDTLTGQINALGVDAIKVGLLYKPERVTPVGVTAALNTPAFVTGGDSADRNRPALAQAFEEVGTGARFVVSVNHLKSKGSACDAPDLGDGQGNCNSVRTNAANLQAAWLAGDPTGTGDTDALIIGDLNSYAMEDPIVALQNAGYTNLIYQFIGPDAYSYVFDGQWGYLDHALANTSLAGQISGVAEWHIDADEPSVLDYNTNFKSPGQIVSLYAPDEFRIGDHDPVLIDLTLTTPTADAGGPYTGDEGQSVALSATGADPNGGTVSFAWDLDNDGVFETPGQNVTFQAVDGTFDYPVAVRVTESDGAYAISSASVQVLNVAPTLGEISAPLDPVQVNQPVDASADFTDPGVLDTHTAVWDWGDGTTAAGTVTETDGSGSVADSHTYTTPGVYRVGLTVTDKDGGSAESFFEYVVIYDPNGGFVSGGGWIDSPAGAYLADPGLSGKATFGFVSRYKKGATVPEGNTEFQFHAAGLNFKSSSYDWLVVAGSKAQFKGVGTIDSEGEYFFMISAEDSAPDTFRIKIWTLDGSGGEQIVYDNGSQQAIGGGSVIVHK
ncbi:predicted extracellular nuclease [Longilinea arvoryzae]|uniref:Predicted extracellular nuclease n=1 Tax=Longilinea arvoryzae TaxID=360412 RepID=A0A0S7BHJ1_9CHLR|nr:ExeM/NucH family extracellular endonuclease [Longilinea arvoryzae]GAP13339.1 predicted extracellular nuclease [Longilinea arvoryzae]